MKTILQAIKDEIYYPVNDGLVENRILCRGLTSGTEFSAEVAQSKEYKGALADCLYSLIQAVNFSEADKSVGALTDAQRKAILKMVNKLYGEIGEESVYDGTPTVYINC